MTLFTARLEPKSLSYGVATTPPLSNFHMGREWPSTPPTRILPPLFSLASPLLSSLLSLRRRWDCVVRRLSCPVDCTVEFTGAHLCRPSLSPTDVAATGYAVARRAATKSERGGHWGIRAIADPTHPGRHLEIVVEMDVKSRLLGKTTDRRRY